MTSILAIGAGGTADGSLARIASEQGWSIKYAEGLGDAVLWTSGAAASLSSGLLLAESSYAVLCLVGGCLTILPMLAAIRR